MKQEGRHALCGCMVTQWEGRGRQWSTREGVGLLRCPITMHMGWPSGRGTRVVSFDVLAAAAAGKDGWLWHLSAARESRHDV
jgi:hypothetical protein